MKKYVSLFLIPTMLSLPAAFAGSNYSYQASPQQTYQQSYYPTPINSANKNTLKGRVVTVPTGQTVPTVVTTPISSNTLTTGQVVNLTLGSDFVYNGSLIAPAGSYVVGNVAEVQKAKHGSLNGKLLIRFNQIVTPYGLQIPINAVIKTSDGTGVLVGGTKADVALDYTKDAVGGAAIGALSGLVFGALAGGSVGQGAALGTAVGAGGGVVKSVIDKGKDVEIPQGSRIEIMLTQPITVSPSSYDYND